MSAECRMLFDFKCLCVVVGIDEDEAEPVEPLYLRN
jgi:hypothetical protein